MGDRALVAHLGPDRYRVVDVLLVTDVVVGGPVLHRPARLPDFLAGRELHLDVHVVVVEIRHGHDGSTRPLTA